MNSRRRHFSAWLGTQCSGGCWASWPSATGQVHEVTAPVGHPQNLVSYHLGRLRKANLVTARFAQPGGATGAVTVLHGKFYQMGLM